MVSSYLNTLFYHFFLQEKQPGIWDKLAAKLNFLFFLDQKCSWSSEEKAILLQTEI